MKKAIGKYIKVETITKEEAIIIAKEIFADHAERDKLYAEGDKLHAECRKLHAEGDKLHAEGDKLYAEGDKLYAERDKLHAEIAIKHNAFIPDHRGFNLIAKDLPNHVYCFIHTRKEIWIYDGETCPDAETVKKLK